MIARWTNKEDKLLIELYSNRKLSPKIIKQRIGRTWTAIQSRASILGVSRLILQPSDEEIIEYIQQIINTCGGKFPTRQIIAEHSIDLQYNLLSIIREKYGGVIGLRKLIGLVEDGDIISQKHFVEKPKINVGDVFGNLTITSSPWYDVTRKHTKWRVKAICLCGWSGEISAENLLTTNERKCHALCKLYVGLKGNNNQGWKGHKEISGTVWGSVIANAKKRNLDFTITIETMWAKYEKQQCRCALTGQVISFAGRTHTASIDRINSNAGYIFDNVQWVHKDINRSKWDMNQQRYIDWCFLTIRPKQFDKLKIDLWNFEKNFHGIGNLSSRYHGCIKTGACTRNILFNINIEYLWELYLQQNGRCAISGVPIYFKLPGNSPRQDGESTASLDRIDSKKGYIANNVQWVHNDINQMKSNFTFDYFMFICNSVCILHNPSEFVIDYLRPKVFEFVNVKAKSKHAEGSRSGKKYKGVFFDKNKQQYVAAITVGGKFIHLGYFNEDNDAAMNYDWHAHKIWQGCFLNFPNVNYDIFVPKSNKVTQLLSMLSGCDTINLEMKDEIAKLI